MIRDASPQIFPNFSHTVTNARPLAGGRKPYPEQVKHMLVEGRKQVPCASAL